MIEVEVEVGDWTDAIDDVEAVVERAAAAALGDREGGIVILLTDDETVRDLNDRFRRKNRPTNVLSFPAADMPGANPQPLGDIVLAYGVCVTEAEEQSKTLRNHLTHLVVHGVLHLLGRDHEVDAEAEAMEGEERVILASLGVSDPYTLPHDD
ncbi:MAG: rRNA maturation RNase YbeY [Brevundimonas subvibrioides]|uniref:Endoribonuclease YbeY n=1 Tax=Brevundimonas subvibrioides TaxID=74313 RepID=A0A258HE05_9CAUL|nr:rRNA maturation RNase YbeY [Brevundimonas subvibrioides]OYX54583.1 MAG: rRNA maturation RNase YbeY [Brevundimonas subvibrioides]